NLAEARCISSPLEGSSLAKTRAFSKPSRAHGPHLRLSTNCYKLSYKKSNPLSRNLSEGCVLQRHAGVAGLPWPLPRGWAKTCSTLPSPLRGWSLQFLFFLLTRRSPRRGSRCQGCAAERRTTGATEERKEPGLDAGASEAYIALLSSRKNSSG